MVSSVALSCLVAPRKAHCPIDYMLSCSRCVAAIHSHVASTLHRNAWPSGQFSHENSDRPDAAEKMWTACTRLVAKGRFLRMISIPKIKLFLENQYLPHNCASKKICSIRYDANLYLLSWKSRKHLYLRPQKSTRSPPPKAADFFGCFFVFCKVNSCKSRIRSTHIEYI